MLIIGNLPSLVKGNLSGVSSENRLVITQVVEIKFTLCSKRFGDSPKKCECDKMPIRLGRSMCIGCFEIRQPIKMTQHLSPMYSNFGGGHHGTAPEQWETDRLRDWPRGNQARPEDTGFRSRFRGKSSPLELSKAIFPKII